MGLSIVLETERGEELDRVDDTKNLLHELLPLHDDVSFQLLRFVDWYADTTFNALQVPVVISELKRIAEEKAKTPEEKALLEDIVRLADSCLVSGPLYVKFYGD